MHDVSEMSAKSEVVTTCSRQAAGKARLHSVAIILIISISSEAFRTMACNSNTPGQQPFNDRCKIVRRVILG